MKLSERIASDLVKIRNLETREKKLEFIWDYYKVPIIVIVCALSLSLISFVSNIGRKNNIMYAVLVNTDVALVEEDDTVFDRLMEQAGYDMSKKTVDVQAEYTLGKSQDANADNETMAVLTALFSISDLDVYASDKPYFDYFAENDGFANLALLLDKDVLNSCSGDLYVYKDSRGNEVTGGVILHAGSPLHQAGYYHNDVIIGIVGNAVNLNEAVAFLNQLLSSRN